MTGVLIKVIPAAITDIPELSVAKLCLSNSLINMLEVSNSSPNDDLRILTPSTV